MKRLPFVTLAIVLVASAFWVAVGSLVVPHALHTDFLSFYTGGLLARQGALHRLYDPGVQAAIERSVFPKAVLMPFIRPPFYALLLAPLTLLPLVPAFWVWLTAQFAALLGCWWWFARRFGYDALVFAALYYPTSVGLANGQDPVWMLAIFLAAYALAERQRDLTAGAVLGLAVIKFHLLFLIPVTLAITRRRRILAGFCGTAALCTVLSLLLGGPGIAAQYYNLLTRRDIQTLDPMPVRMINVRALALNIGVDSFWITALLTVAVIGLLAVAAWRSPLWRWFSAGCAATLLVAPHIYNYDAGILLLPILLAIFCSGSKFTRILAATAVTPIPHMAAFFGPPYSIAPVLAIFLFLAALARESYLEKSATEPLKAIAQLAESRAS